MHVSVSICASHSIFSLCLFCFITFFYLPVCFLKSEKKGINFNGGDDLRGGGGRKTLIRVNCMIKKSLKLKKNQSCCYDPGQSYYKNIYKRDLLCFDNEISNLITALRKKQNKQ